jgi:hypothetical protein
MVANRITAERRCPAAVRDSILLRLFLHPTPVFGLPPRTDTALNCSCQLSKCHFMFRAPAAKIRFLRHKEL